MSKKTEKQTEKISYKELLGAVEDNLREMQEQPEMDLDEVLSKVAASYDSLKILRERLSTYELKFEELKNAVSPQNSLLTPNS